MDLDNIKVDILEGDYQSAISEGEKIMADTQYSPDLDELYYLLGISYLKQGNYLRASDIFEIIIKEFKNSRFKQEAEIGLGDSYFLMGEYAKAEGFYKDFLGSGYAGSFKPQALYKTALCAVKLGKTDEAKEYLEKLNREYPSNIDTAVDKDLSGTGGRLYYAVQVGAFSNPENAGGLLGELTRRGYPAYIEETGSTGGGISYRVRVGRAALRQEAETVEQALSLDGYPAKIVSSEK